MKNIIDAISRLIQWIIFVAIISLLPYLLNSLIYPLTNHKIYSDGFDFIINLLLFSVVISIDNLKNISTWKLDEIFQAIHFIFFSLCLAWIIIPSIIFGMIIVVNERGLTPIEYFDMDLLIETTTVASMGSFITGIIVQIILLILRGDEKND